MDTEFLRSISDDHPDMTMMMHLDDYSAVHDNDQHNINTTNLMNPNYLMENSDFTNPISFTSPSQTTEMQFLSSPRWRNNGSDDETDQHKRNSMAAMREMIFRIAAMQPINIDPESIKPPKRRNVKISKDPQSVAARHRREKISEKIRILQRLVPGGTKMDTASMLDEAIHYMKFLKNQVQALEKVGENRPPMAAGIGFPVPMTSGSYVNPMGTSAKGYQEMENNNIVYHSLGA